MRRLLVSLVLAPAICIGAVVWSAAIANAATADLKIGVMAGSLGQGYALGFGFSSSKPDSDDLLYKAAVVYAGITDPADIKNEARAERASANTLLNPNREGALRLGLGWQLGRKKRAFLTFEVGAGSARGETDAEYVQEKIWHDEKYRSGWWEYKMGRKTFSDDRTYWLAGIGPELELFIDETSRVSIDVEATVGKIFLTTTWLSEGGQKKQDDASRPYYRFRFSSGFHW